MKNKKLLSLISIFFLIALLTNIATNPIINEQNDISNRNEKTGLKLSESTISSNDLFTGKGEELNSTEYAQSTNASQSIDGLSSTQDKFGYINTPPKWTGYKLFAEVEELYDNTTWEENGGINGQSPWQYDEYDLVSGGDENCQGSYVDQSTLAGLGIVTETGALYTRTIYAAAPNDPLDAAEYAAFNQTIALDRGDVSFCRLDFVYWSAQNPSGTSTGFIEINGYKVNFNAFPQSGYATPRYEKIEIPTSELPYIFGGVDNVTIKVGIDVTTTAVLTGGTLDARIYFDNITLWIEGQAKPSQVDLKLNGTSVNDDNYGLGNIALNGNWENPSQTLDQTLIGDFSTNATDVRLKTSLTQYITKNKSSQDTNGNPYSDFAIESGKSVNWTTYFYGSKPELYEAYNFTTYFPSDWTAWAIYDPIPNEVLSLLNEGSDYLDVPSSRANDFPGLWKLQFNSPNYVNNINFYENTTIIPGPSDWTQTNNIFAGNILNITADIKTDGLTTNLDQTQAYLNIKFPNGTIWTQQAQIKSVSSNPNGKVFFDPIIIPDSGANYVAGKYKVFVTWNNSYSSFGLNETGMLLQELTIQHHSKLNPDSLYYADLLEDTNIALKTYFMDKITNSPISNGLLYFENLTGQTQIMTEIAPGYYYAEINGPAAYKGENIITINANHSYYENITIDVIVEVVLDTLLKSSNSPSVTVPWNVNASIQLNLTELNTQNGVESGNFTNDWSGESWISETANGIYTLYLNTSTFGINTINTVTISNEDIGYNPSSLAIDVKINPRSSNYILYLNQSDETSTGSYNLPIYTHLNISLNYFDVLNGSTINTASVLLKGTPLGDQNVPLINGIFQYDLESSILGVGIHSLSLEASSLKNTKKIIPLIITVENRDGQLELFLNKLNKTLSKSIEVPIHTYVNISADYFDNNSTDFIGAEVLLIGVGPDKTMVYQDGMYFYNLSTSDLGPGIHSLSITANKTNAEFLSIQFTINIKKRTTDLTLYLNTIDSTSSKSIDVKIHTSVNITINYYDLLNSSTIQPATINLTGIGSGYQLLNLQNGMYYYNLLTTDLGTGIHTLKIVANASNDFTTKTIEFIVVINNRTTDAELLLNTFDKTNTKSIEIYAHSSLNISLNYYDVTNGSTIIGASVNLLDFGLGSQNLILTNGIYQYKFDETYALTPGIYEVILIASKDDFDVFEITFNLIIKNRMADINIFLDGLNKTTTKSIEIDIHDSLNISINYFDMNGTTITPANVFIEDFGYGDLSLDFLNSIYQKTINTDLLGVGIHSLTIYSISTNNELIEDSITIIIKKINADVTLYLEEQDKTISKSVEVQYLDLINVSIDYFNSSNNNPLSGGSVTLTGGI